MNNSRFCVMKNSRQCDEQLPGRGCYSLIWCDEELPDGVMKNSRRLWISLFISCAWLRVMRDEQLPRIKALEINDLAHYRGVIHAEQLPEV